MQHLVFDIGMHMGEDLGFYLKRGERVIAVDADPLMIELATRKFNKYIKENKLVLINRAVSDKDGEILNFNLSSNSHWNSLIEDVSARKSGFLQSIEVKSVTLTALMKEFGTPYYCKIDIEGMDNICLQSLISSIERPKFISVETECLADNSEDLNDHFLETLSSLQKLGYTKFQLIDQESLQSLHLNKKFYVQRSKLFYYTNRLLSKFRFRIQPFASRDKLSHQFSYYFPAGSSGVYGKDLGGKWYNYNEAKQLLIQHRKDYFNLKKAVSYGFWCDWHATT